MSSHKKKFYKVLKDIFIGERIEGKGGYVNLMKVKSLYYRSFEKELDFAINKALAHVGQDFRDEMYRKLYTFFKRYFSESGSIFFARTPVHEKIYEKIYSDDKDVMLFWKTKDLYYVKTERLYHDLEIEIDEYKYKFYLTVKDLEHKQSNEKKEIIFEFDEIDDKGVIVCKVQHAQNGKKTKIADIHKALKKRYKNITTEVIERAFSTFKKQSEVDYFIHKNAGAFLREQFDFWIKGYVMDDESVFNAERLAQLKALKDIAYKIINVVAQFEDELVKVWNKPKFVRNSNYVITLDRIADKDTDLIDTILKHPKLSEQIKEWQDLGMINEAFTPDLITAKNDELFENGYLHHDYKYLPIDTRYFKDLELQILALFDHLDDALDGWLIHSENYQALNTIKEKFRGKIQATYIDPPYNTDASSIIYVNNYKSSSWLTLMENRLSVNKDFLKNDGIICIAIDDEQLCELKPIVKDLFPKEVGIVPVRSNPAGRKTRGKFAPAHEYAVFYGASENSIPGSLELTEKRLARYPKEDENGRFAWANFIRSGQGDKREDRVKMFYPIYVNENDKIRVPKLEWNEEKQEYDIIENLKKNETAVYPIIENEDGSIIEKRWQRGHVRMSKELTEYRIRRTGDKISIDFKTRMDENSLPTTWWDKKEYASANYGALELKKLFFEKDFDFPKAKELVKDCLRVQCRNNEGYIMDYFSGSGTTAHAIFELNKEDKGKRKMILIELGNHYHKVILPRIKKLSFSLNWSNGKAVKSDSVGGFFKYYQLEQYEEALQKVRYEDKPPLASHDLFHQYIFLKDPKLNQALTVEGDNIKTDLNQLYRNIDIPETLSNLTGKAIKRITADSVVFEDDTSVNTADLDYKLIKPLIWW